MKRSRQALAGLCGVILAVAVAAEAFWPTPAGPQVLPDNPVPLTFAVATGGKGVTVEIADTPERRSRGLMYRASIGHGHAMLFVYPYPVEVGFWMENTPSPLDLVFVGPDLRVSGLARGRPFSREAMRSPGKVKAVVEMEAGAAASMGIVAGTPVSHPSLAER